MLFFRLGRAVPHFAGVCVAFFVPTCLGGFFFVAGVAFNVSLLVSFFGLVPFEATWKWEKLWVTFLF